MDKEKYTGRCDGCAYRMFERLTSDYLREFMKFLLYYNSFFLVDLIRKKSCRLVGLQLFWGLVMVVADKAFLHQDGQDVGCRLTLAFLAASVILLVGDGVVA